MTAIMRNNVTLGGVAGRRPMLFVHGLGHEQDLWHAVGAAFGTDHRLVSIDLVGAGGSERGAFDPERYGSLWGHADDVVELCEELDLRDVVLVGHSAGAMVGALAASRAPDRFGALVLIAPSPRYIDDDGYVGGSSPEAVEGLLAAMSDYEAWCEQVPRAFMGNADRPELGQRLVESFRASDPETTRHFARTVLRSDHREDLAAVTTRSLVVQASEETLAPLAVGEFVHDRLPDSELVVLRAAGHFPHVSAPAETVAAIYGFLAGGSSDGAAVASSPDPRGDAEFEDLYEHAPFGYVSTGLDWTVLRVNQTLLSWLGRERAELVGHPFDEAFAPAAQRFHRDHVAPRVGSEDVLREVAIDLQRADGSSMPVLLSSVVRTDDRGMRTIRSSMLDATQRHAYERRLLLSRRRSERRMRLIERVVADLAGAGDITEVARVVTDATTEAFGDVNCSVWLLDADGSELVELAAPGQAARRLARQVVTAETEVLRSNGVVVDDARRVVAAAARHGLRAVGALVLEGVDTQRFDPDDRGLLGALGRQAGHALDRALSDERRDAMLSMVSHELRTPLTPIVGFSELALGRYPDLSAETRQAFEIIKRNGEHLIAVVEDLLNLTRSRRGSIVATPVGVELPAFVGRLLADLREGDVGVKEQVSHAVAWVDPDHLTQILTNLLSNARRYGRPPVVVTLDADDGATTVAVEDAGDGVPVGFVDRLFDPFTQAVTSDRHATVGLGLGLSIARELVAANGGRLAYAPTGGGGARFVLSLPSDPPSSPVRR
jgi:sigma-B regulation protein RsbQ